MPKKKNIKAKAVSNNYSDIYLLPIPKKNLSYYRKIASRFGKLARQYGALDYREFAADDLFPKGTISFARAAKPAKDEVVIAAVVDFASRRHRDTVNRNMFKDPQMAEMIKESENNPMWNMKKMYYGGFKTIVKA